MISSVKRAEELSRELNVRFSLGQPIQDLIEYIKSDYNRKSAKKYNNDANMEIKERFSKKNETPRCIYPFTQMVIFAEGTVSPCCILWKKKPENIEDSILDRSLSDVWYGNFFENFRLKMKNGGLPPHCHGCFL
jgi:MoaA/NifB/PqqE/SkfB family radical SAM enzyme